MGKAKATRVQKTKQTTANQTSLQSSPPATNMSCSLHTRGSIWPTKEESIPRNMSLPLPSLFKPGWSHNKTIEALLRSSHVLSRTPSADHPHRFIFDHGYSTQSRLLIVQWEKTKIERPSLNAATRFSSTRKKIQTNQILTSRRKVMSSKLVRKTPTSHVKLMWVNSPHKTVPTQRIKRTRWSTFVLEFTGQH